MKIKSSITLALILTGFASMGAAHAAEPSGGWYLGASAGVATTTATLNSTGTSLTQTDKTDTALSLRSGYRFNANWAVEGGYADLGKSKYQQVGFSESVLKTALWHVDAVGTLPLADRFAVFGKLGVAFINYEVGGYKEHKTTPHLGLGASYALTPAVVLRAEYDDYGKARFTDGSASLDIRSHQFSLGMDYRF